VLPGELEHRGHGGRHLHELRQLDHVGYGGGYGSCHVQFHGFERLIYRGFDGWRLLYGCDLLGFGFNFGRLDGRRDDHGFGDLELVRPGDLEHLRGALL
jgi:hypothetical protein